MLVHEGGFGDLDPRKFGQWVGMQGPSPCQVSPDFIAKTSEYINLARGSKTSYCMELAPCSNSSRVWMEQYGIHILLSVAGLAEKKVTLGKVGKGQLGKERHEKDWREVQE